MAPVRATDNSTPEISLHWVVQVNVVFQIVRRPAGVKNCGLLYQDVRLMLVNVPLLLRAEENPCAIADAFIDPFDMAVAYESWVNVKAEAFFACVLLSPLEREAAVIHDLQPKVGVDQTEPLLDFLFSILRNQIAGPSHFAFV